MEQGINPREIKRVPQETVWRLFSYLRALFGVLGRKDSVSSFELADSLGINPNQLRKDLSYFGKFGRRGVGYKVKELTDNINKILGLTRTWNVALCGFGNLGKALSSYEGFLKQGFTIKIIFESDPRKIGKKFNNVEVASVADLAGKIKKHNIQIAILAVPADQAQFTAEALYKAGVKAILNFAPLNINLPPDCLIRNADMSSELVYLSYFLAGGHTRSV
jgi:redox-sensing transcriptional repressor